MGSMATLVAREVLVRVLVETILASGRAEVVSLVATERTVFGRSRVDHHSANRIRLSSCACHVASFASKFLMFSVRRLADQRWLRNGIPRWIAFENRAAAR